MKVLVADDEAVSRRMLSEMLKRWGYEVVSARDGLEALECLNSDDPPRLTILDWMMPGASGLEVCRTVRHRNREPYIYIILLTSRDRREDIIEGLEAGADDYITKPFDPHELKVRLRAGRRILDLQAKLIEAREALRNQATHDALTGLYNRQAILDLLGHEFERARRQWSPVTLFMLDIDHFKRINDTHGHLAGDMALAGVAQLIRQSIRKYDVACRYGGEEIAILMPEADLRHARHLAERIRKAVMSRPFGSKERQFTLTISCGASVSSPAMESPEELVSLADQALYRAKEKGRNRVELYLPLGGDGTDGVSGEEATETIERDEEGEIIQ